MGENIGNGSWLYSKAARRHLTVSISSAVALEGNRSCCTALPWFGTVVKRSIYGGIKDAGQRFVLKRRQTLQVTFVRMAVGAPRHQLLLTVAIVAQRGRMVKFQVVRKFVASIPAYLTLVTKFFQDLEPFGARYFLTLVFFYQSHKCKSIGRF